MYKFKREDIIEFPNLLTKRIHRIVTQTLPNGTRLGPFVVAKINGTFRWISLCKFRVWYLESYACPILDRCKNTANLYEMVKYLSNKSFKVAETFSRHVWEFDENGVRIGTRVVQMPYLIRFYK